MATIALIKGDLFSVSLKNDHPLIRAFANIILQIMFHYIWINIQLFLKAGSAGGLQILI
jgi:hypothetical protein